MVTELTATAGRRAELGRRVLFVALAILLALTTAFFGARVAYASIGSEGGRFVHSTEVSTGNEDTDAAIAEMEGMTWEEVKDARELDSSAAAEDWSSRPLGGLAYPGFDIFHLLDIALPYGAFTLVESACGGLVEVCNQLFEFIGQTDSLTLDYNSSTYGEIYGATVSISEQVIQPVAVGFLGLALVLELLQFSREVATNRGDHFSMAGSYVWIIVKFALVMTLIGHTTLITRGIYELFLALTRSMISLLAGITPSGQTFDSFMVGLQEITYADWGQILIMLIVGFVMVIAVAITVIRVLVLTVTRMFEIYVRAAFSGFPLVMITSRQTRDGGIRYFKEFAGACLQAAVLVVMVTFSGIIISTVGILLQVPDGVGGIAGTVISALAPIAGVFGVNAVIGMSRDIANRILGA